MKLLLDTHIFLWFITGDDRLIPRFRSAIEESEDVYLSVVSLWEATIKFQLGKLPLPGTPHPWLSAQREQHGIASLLLNEASVSRLADLPPHHRDPFDRMLVAQATVEGITLLTLDKHLARYAGPVRLMR